MKTPRPAKWQLIEEIKHCVPNWTLSINTYVNLYLLDLKSCSYAHPHHKGSQKKKSRLCLIVGIKAFNLFIFTFSVAYNQNMNIRLISMRVDRAS